jgi:hypothetical protein
MTIVQGYVVEAAAVASAIEGQDGVLSLRPRYIETERWLRGYATLCAQWSSGPYGVSCTCRFSESGMAGIS